MHWWVTRPLSQFWVSCKGRGEGCTSSVPPTSQCLAALHHSQLTANSIASTHADPTSIRRVKLDRHACKSQKPRSITLQRGRAGRFVRFWASGEQSSPKSEISCLGRRWTAVQNLTPLALSSAEKSVTTQTHKQTHTQTVDDISTPCLSACVRGCYVTSPDPIWRHIAFLCTFYSIYD